MSNIYEVIIKAIEEDINRGLYKPGKRLPSVRELSIKYNCSKNTVVKAYETLRSNHIIYSIPQSGYYIVEKLISNTPKQSEVINFYSGNPIVGNMNTPDLKHCLDRAVDIYKDNSLSSSAYGVESLREILPKYLSDFQIFTSANNIFVNLGIQQALSILTQIPFPNGKDVILIEQPTYSYFINFLKYCGTKVIGIERDEQGIDLNKLEHIFKNEKIKFFYTVPRNHSPLGTSYSKKQRQAIARLADKYDVYIVEDDYFADISFDRKYDPIYSYSEHSRNFYLKSFSKILPWMRIGLIVAPTHMINVLEQYRTVSYYYSYFSASLISQATLEIYIRSNILKKHVDHMVKELQEKQKKLNSNFQRLEELGVRCIGGNSGFYSYLLLQDYIDENKFAEDLKNDGVLVSKGKRFFLDKSFYKKGIRLSIASVSCEDIDKGLNIITNKLEKYLK
ncbi:PLP-dependent aminotransferase family protein [Clostridium sp. SYSU_GA19001]|uniref:aminotransferase-like domain-containing protein n=1 Tax=Clostridium caldaquaticum TaxID=2940653 RepID=UPI002077345C|nr:PLP-dependent aminotransferase family protein [Clostridium caldaquaticum]MCM8709852.1 PLP-dependent aminotransferase family protein [Clostridium caldaquaticum]